MLNASSLSHRLQSRQPGSRSLGPSIQSNLCSLLPPSVRKLFGFRVYHDVKFFISAVNPTMTFSWFLVQLFMWNKVAETTPSSASSVLHLVSFWLSYNTVCFESPATHILLFCFCFRWCSHHQAGSDQERHIQRTELWVVVACPLSHHYPSTRRHWASVRLHCSWPLQYHTWIRDQSCRLEFDTVAFVAYHPVYVPFSLPLSTMYVITKNTLNYLKISCIIILTKVKRTLKSG